MFENSFSIMHSFSLSKRINFIKEVSAIMKFMLFYVLRDDKYPNGISCEMMNKPTKIMIFM